MWDLSQFIATSTELEWTEILPFFQDPFATYHDPSTSSSSVEDYNINDGREGDYVNSQTLIIPLDGNILSMYYRRDLFQQFNITIPRTWDEYNQAAAFFHGKPLGPRGTPLVGSCVSRIDRCANQYWTSLILASITQTHGTTSGFFLDPSTLKPLFGPAMDETLRILREQFLYGHEGELTGECFSSNYAFNEGKCALTYNWGNQIVRPEFADIFDVGVAPTPGSPVVFDRDTKALVSCTAMLCPHAEYYEDIGFVNQAPYAAHGGWVGGISNQVATEQRYAAADFLAYLSNSRQSLADVLPNRISSFAQPYRYSHVTSWNWIDAGFAVEFASEYTEAVRRINSENSVLELRTEYATAMANVVDEEVYRYLLDTVNSMSVSDDLILRGEIVLTMQQRIENLVRANDRRGSEFRLSDVYRRSIGYTDTSQQDMMNYINEDFRDAAWGLSGLMCVTAVTLMIWTFRQRNNKVMKAFQPFLLFQSITGIFLMSTSVIPLGLDDSSYSIETLNITCMLAPWLYVVGFTIFFSAVYAKIRECLKIYEDPRNHKILLVQPKSCFRLCVRLLILNGTILGLWTGLDPLKWKRQEVEGGLVLEDGTVETYGACRGENAALGFEISLYALNMTMAIIAMLQAFKCRFLVLEYNEMQWLPLSVFPFFEVWLIGGPILTIVRDDPTVTFVVISMMIVGSTTVGGMAAFAPKDWYIRKYYHSNPQQSSGFPERTTSAGIMVLQHPTVESQKQIEALSFKIDQVEGWNTELEIEIRLMKEKFKELTTTEKFHIQESILKDAMTDGDTNEYRSSKGMEEYEQNEISKSNDEGLAAMEHFQQVWIMPEEEEEDEIQVASLPKPSSYQSLHSIVSSLGNEDDGQLYHESPRAHGMKSALEIPNIHAPSAMSDSSSTTPEDPLASLMRLAKSEDSILEDSHSPQTTVFESHRDDDDDDDQNDSPPIGLNRLAMTGFNDYEPIHFAKSQSRPDTTDVSHDLFNIDEETQSDRAGRLAVTHMDRKDDEPEIPSDPQENSDDGDLRDPLARLTMTGFNVTEAEAGDAKERHVDPHSRLAMTGFEDKGENNTGPQDPLERLAMTGFNDQNDREESDHYGDPLERLALTYYQDDDDEVAVVPDARAKSSVAKGDADEDQSGYKDIVARIIAMRLAASDAGDVVDRDSVNSDREDPLERIMNMGDDEPSEQARNNERVHVRPKNAPNGQAKKAGNAEDENAEDKPDKELLARIVALRLAAADDDDGDYSVHSTREDPLERIMNMNAEDQLISAVTLMRYLGPEGNDDDGADVIIRNQDFRDLSSMIQDNDLQELERRAALLAESVKTKLTDSNLADLTHDTETTVDSDTGLGYLALATGGHKDVVNTSHVMNGLDISKISDDGDRRFVSMSDSILDSPGRVNKVEEPSKQSLGTEQLNGHTKLSAGESSTDTKTRTTLSAAAAAALDQGDGGVAQFAGEPSQGENSRFSLGWNGTRKKETINDEAFRSPSIQPKRPVNIKNSSVNDQGSPISKAYPISDWSAVGGLANVLADWSDSQSSTSYAESNPDSIVSAEATTRASMLDTPVAKELDHLVGKMDWDGVKAVAHKYETSVVNSTTMTSQTLDVTSNTISALDDKRRKKREIEAWKQSLTKSLAKG